MDSADLVGEIQSSDVSSQGSFIDINGLLIPQQSVLSLNNQDLLFNLQDTNQLVVPNKIIFGNVVNQKKVKSKANISLLKSASECADFIQNTCQNEVKSDKTSSSVFDSSSLFRVVNEDGSNAVLNVDGVLFEKPSETNGELQLTAVDEEPDSTVTSDESDEQLNIDELATVITAYRCKKCEFTCNDREQFFVHFKEIHMKPVST